ncbi:PilZ domain-containing protein [Roseomonas sp. SSH11]|uniref:PilZ domain-containing protein n=1 Tax=Pararoseomonas baculiformis TaxID=2820812 RepID=A0ABS4AIG6_9PROT|nr:PilZ domain-containing protein [Pararoseomonas baculiformis]MBP0446817.1 PilZ domain-containing protein [Pararoseomonas baculiformis]
MEQQETGGQRHERRGRRDRVLKSAQVVFGGAAIDCVVLDISSNGARVSFSSPVEVPELLALRLNDGSTYPALRRWVRGTDMGLQFTGPVMASGDEGHLRRAHQAMEALRAARGMGWLEILRAERHFGDEALREAAHALEAAHQQLEAALMPHVVQQAGKGPG